jgi:hypothetical protein
MVCFDLSAFWPRPIANRVFSKKEVVMGVGDLEKVKAWVDTMPPRPGRLVVIGRVVAPTPCHEAKAVLDAIEKSNPPVYVVKVTVHPLPGRCLQVLHAIDFRFVLENYADDARQVRVISEKDSLLVDIEEVS